jgi:aminoglycoside/choline kinase family phosphotransferase
VEIRVTNRFELLQHWLTGILVPCNFSVTALTGDASFRRYYRVHSGRDSYIAMDAPPDKLDCQPFITIAALLKKRGIHVPEILASDMENGFLLLDDLGDQQYLLALNRTNADVLYRDALDALLLLQAAGHDDHSSLPDYDRALLMRELGIFHEWVLQRYLSLDLNDSEQRSLQQVFQWLCDNALEQPKVCVHRDYHSRNLMVTSHNNPGVLDFQDAVIGPLTYDLVSLLRDCYIAWPREQVIQWVLSYRSELYRRGFEPGADEAIFLRWFDLTGVQRHLKAAGLFVRLKIRDGKAGFWQDIPRTLGYVIEVSEYYPELLPLKHLLVEHLPRLVR